MNGAAKCFELTRLGNISVRMLGADILKYLHSRMIPPRSGSPFEASSSCEETCSAHGDRTWLLSSAEESELSGHHWGIRRKSSRKASKLFDRGSPC